MPLQWKKAMNTRVSQLVNDHLHRSQKRRDGSSLVVETGFPTSLVDLFIKNREKLKKSPKKKRQNPPVPINDPVIVGGTTKIPPLITGLPLRSPPASPPRVPCVGLSEIRAVGGSFDGTDERECVSDTVVDANTVLLVVLKMFLVVVLALGTKRLTVGITISAFLLFFLEYVGKHARFALKPSLDGKGVLGLLRFNKVVKKDENFIGVLMPKPDEEIQPVNEIETQPENEIIERSGSGHQEIEYIEVMAMGSSSGPELNKRKSRKDKIKSKMKKLFPKKLRCSRKGSGSQRVEDYSISSRDERAVQCEDERGSENFSSELSFDSSLRNREEEEEEMSVVRSVGERSETDEKSEEIGNGLNWRYLVLCVIVLAGLIGGRGFAVILTLTWFLILKFGERLTRYTQVPMIKPSN